MNYKIIPATLLASISLASAATFTEDFSTNPATTGWQIFGDSSLFHWNTTNQNLEVTWNSSKPNSYFHHPLGTIVSKDDDFSLAFDLKLSDVTIGTDTNKPYTFQLALGLLNFADATRTNFIRGSGFESPNLIELTYFPDSGFGATVAPTFIDQTAFNYNSGGFTFPLELTTGDQFHVVMTYTASNRTLVTVMTRNGQPFGPILDATLGASFTDFRVDRLAIMSYSDLGQDPMFAGSILADGIIDNLTVTTPPPPVANVVGSVVGGSWQMECVSRTNWLYTLQKTTDFQAWSDTSATITGNGSSLTLQDTNTPTANAFYRVRASKP